MSLPDSLKREMQLFQSRTKRSGEIYEEAKEYIPFGVNSNYRYSAPYPIYVRKAKGTRLWDVDGNEYIDYFMAYGVLTTGHSHPRLIEVISERIKEGTILGFEFEDSHRLAKVICRRFNVDMVRFSTTGLECTHHAIRLARAYTQRNKIIKFLGTYHGSHDYMLVSTKPNIYAAGHYKYPAKIPSSPGIPKSTLEDIVIAQFNDLESVEDAFKKYPDDISAVILEPVPMNMGVILPKKGFLEGLRKLCDEYGAILIFDEVKTSGKYYGGASEAFGVEPDMKVMSKAIAGGFPLSVIAGKREIISHYGPGLVAHAGTFNSNPVSITAGLVTLEEILTRDAMNRAIAISEDLAKGYRDILSDAGIENSVVTFGTSGNLYFTSREIHNYHDMLKYLHIGRWFAFYVAMMNRGILPSAFGFDEQWTVSILHTGDDNQKHLDALQDVVPLLKEDIPNIRLLSLEAY
jgi:glutamate-1-semialdehyde 2,1-aminomutase